jgi:peptide/nickel transport system substrate-binding protein
MSPVSGDPAELQSLYSQAQKLLVDDVPSVPTYQNHTITARKTYVKGLIADTSHNTLILTGAWLDK